MIASCQLFIQCQRRLGPGPDRLLGTTELEYDFGSITCAASYGGGGCFGVVNYDKTSDLSVIVVDVDTTRRLVNLGAESTGARMISVVGVIPLWYDAPTRSAACRSLAEQLNAELE